jgi:hypothetical protein
MKMKAFTFSGFFMEMFVFIYLPVAITRLPNYHNRSTDFKFKITEIDAGIKNGRTKSKR